MSLNVYRPFKAKSALLAESHIVARISPNKVLWNIQSKYFDIVNIIYIFLNIYLFFILEMCVCVCYKSGNKISVDVL